MDTYPIFIIQCTGGSLKAGSHELFSVIPFFLLRKGLCEHIGKHIKGGLPTHILKGI